LSQDIHTTFDGVTKTKQKNGEIVEVEYVIGGSVDPNSNHATDANDQLIQGTGIVFKTYLDKTTIGTTVYDEKKDVSRITKKWRKTEFNHNSGGRRITPTPYLDSNMVLQAIFKEEEFSGIVFPPEVEDNVFIIRGVEDIFERHAAMAEIKTRNDIDEYRDNYY
jgi:hypothetical protein